MKSPKIYLAGLIAVASFVVANRKLAQSSATLIDSGSGAPVPGVSDQYQLSTPGGTSSPDGLNYYFDNSVPPGQTFTTGTNLNGYLLKSIYIRTAGGSGNLPVGGQAYTLRLYSVSGSAATPVATYQSQNGFIFTDTDWLQWSNLNIGLQPNSRYAYSFGRNSAGYENLANINGNPYAGGEVCLIPIDGGTLVYGQSHNYDASFDVSLGVASSVLANPPTISPGNPVQAGTTAVLSTAPAVGAGPLFYQWVTDGGSGGALTNISGATNTSTAVTTTGYVLGVNYRFAVVVTNSSSTTTSTVAVLNVSQFAGATLTDVGTVIAPTPDNISQLSNGGNGDGLNYYDDNNPAPGQTFTTGANPQGYSLNSVTIDTGGGTDNGVQTPQNYSLYIYTVSGSTATVIATYTNANFSFSYGDWLTWSGFPALTLNPNTTYAYAFRRNNTGWAGMQSSTGSSDLYAGGQLGLIPAGGGTMSFGTTGLSDATFDIGLTPIGVGPNPHPYAGVIAVSPSATVSAGTQVTLTDSPTGSSPLYFRWLTDGGSGGSLTNIPGATATNLSINTTGWSPNGYHYAFAVSNSVGSVTSLVSTVTVVYTNSTAFLQDIGGVNPQPLLPNDVAQTLQGGGAPDGLNYWSDNYAPPGQTFVTGNNAGGYALTSLAVRTGTGSYGGLPAGGQAYQLSLYSVSGNNATLYATLTSQTNFTFTPTNWLRWSGFALPLSANRTYAYSFARLTTGSGYVNMSSVTNNPYANGEVALIPAGGGMMTLGSSHNFDGTFILGFAAPGYPIVSPPVLSASSIYAGQPISASATVTGTGPFTYQWQTDGGNTGTLTNIPGAVSTNLTQVTPAQGATQVAYRLLGSNGSGTTTGEVAIVNLVAPTAPVILSDINPPFANGYVGGTVTFSVDFSGSPNINYQWQVDKGTGATNILHQTNSILVLTNLQLSDAGDYSLFASDAQGPNESLSSTLTVYTNPPTGTAVNFQWHSSEGGDAGIYSGTGLPGFGSGNNWNQVVGPSSWAPGSYISSSGLADDGVTDTGMTWTLNTAGSWSQTGDTTVRLLDSYALSYGTQSFMFTLPNGGYNLALFSCDGHEAITSGPSATAFTINGVTKVAMPTQDSSFVQGNNYVVFSNVVVTANTLIGTWSVTNNLSFGAVNGAQLIYLGQVASRPVLTAQYAGNQLTLSWPSAGWTLQVQTNSAGAGLSANWVNVPGSSSTTSEIFTANRTVSGIFYRLVNQ